MPETGSDVTIETIDRSQQASVDSLEDCSRQAGILPAKQSDATGPGRNHRGNYSAFDDQATVIACWEKETRRSSECGCDPRD